jgi:hypothetical protein
VGTHPSDASIAAAVDFLAAAVTRTLFHGSQDVYMVLLLDSCERGVSS